MKKMQSTLTKMFVAVVIVAAVMNLAKADGDSDLQELARWWAPGMPPDGILYEGIFEDGKLVTIKSEIHGDVVLSEPVSSDKLASLVGSLDRSGDIIQAFDQAELADQYEEFRKALSYQAVPLLKTLVRSYGFEEPES